MIGVRRRSRFDNTSGQRERIELNNLWGKALTERALWGTEKESLDRLLEPVWERPDLTSSVKISVPVAVHIQKELYTVILYSLLFAPWLFLNAFWKQQSISSHLFFLLFIRWMGSYYSRGDLRHSFPVSLPQRRLRISFFVCVFLSRNLLLPQLSTRTTNCCSPCWLCVFREQTLVCVCVLVDLSHTHHANVGLKPPADIWS